MTQDTPQRTSPPKKRKWPKRLLIALLIIIALLFIAYKTVPYYFSGKIAEATYFEDDIAAFEAQDKANPPAPGKVLFIGSSSIRFWDTLEQDMEPLNVLNRGFGGSMLHHSTFFADRIVTPYKPSAIVLYAGDNDIGNLQVPRTATQLLQDFDAFLAKVHKDVGPIPVLYIAIKPSELRTAQWPEMRKANGLIAERAESQPLLHFIDIATPMLDEKGTPRGEFLVWDGLHMNEKGYALWTSLVRPVLEKALEEKPAN